MILARNRVGAVEDIGKLKARTKRQSQSQSASQSQSRSRSMARGLEIERERWARPVRFGLAVRYAANDKAPALACRWPQKNGDV